MSPRNKPKQSWGFDATDLLSNIAVDQEDLYLGILPSRTWGERQDQRRTLMLFPIPRRKVSWSRLRRVTKTAQNHQGPTKQTAAVKNDHEWKMTMIPPLGE